MTHLPYILLSITRQLRDIAAKKPLASPIPGQKEFLKKNPLPPIIGLVPS
jgi:hypothetical protein